MHNDRFNLERFLMAQQGMYASVLAELRSGRKVSHWMWFIFPQLAGLGHSSMAMRYAISGVEEARAYLEHAILGVRLIDCTQRVLDVSGRDLHAIFGSPDDMKFRSCMTLFSRVATRQPLFQQAIDQYCDARPDPRTMALLDSD
jgi:uncharacterized protein (DUF1810 family)